MLEAVGRTADPGEDEDEEIANESPKSEEGDGDGMRIEIDENAEGEEHGKQSSEDVGKRERAAADKINKKIQETLDKQNADIDADMNRGKGGRLKYLLQQTEIFAHFAKGSQSQSEKTQNTRVAISGHILQDFVLSKK